MKYNIEAFIVEFSLFAIVYTIFYIFNISDKIELKKTLKRCTKKTKATLLSYRYEINSLKATIDVEIYYKYKFVINDIEYTAEPIMLRRFKVSGTIDDISKYIEKSVGEETTWVYNPNDKREGYTIDQKDSIEKRANMKNVIIGTSVVLIVMLLIPLL